MASSTKNVKIGVCRIYFNGVDLGYTSDGVAVEVSTETKEVTVDQFGSTPISEYITGRTIKVTTSLAETTLTNLVATMPGASLSTDGNTATVDTGVGNNLLDGAKELRLHPIGLDDSDKSEDLVIPLAASAGSMSFSYKLDDERVFDVTFNGYPAESGVLFYLGKDQTEST